MNYPTDYKKNNPNIIKRIEQDSGKEFHYLFMGIVGSGKTYLADIITDSIKGFECYTSRSIYNQYLQVIRNNSPMQGDEVQDVLDAFTCKSLFLDDIGTEPNKTNPHEFIGSGIMSRYRFWQQGRIEHTIYTTNLNSTKLVDVYGHRVVDRLTEMCTVMEFDKRNFRKRKLDKVSH